MQAAKYIQQISRSLIRHSSSSSQLTNAVAAALVTSSTSNATAAVASYSTAASALMFSSQLDLKNKSNTTHKLVKSTAQETQQQRRIEVKFFNDRIKFKILEPALAYKSMPYIWLRANCMCPTCYNRVAQESEIDWARTDEMSIEPVEIEETTRPLDSSSSSSNETTNVVRVTWSDGHKSEYELAELARLVLAGCDHTQQQTHHANSRILWNRHSLERCNNGGLTRLPYQAYLNDNNVLRLALANLYKFGAVIVNEVISI